MGVSLLLPLFTTGTAFISGLTGLAGGAILMGVLAAFFNPINALVLHAFFQTFSNIFRLILHWKNIDKTIFTYFAIAVIPGTYLGSLLVGKLPTELLKILLGFGILLSFLPKKKNAKDFSSFFYSLIGFFAGFLGCLIGAVGPLVARFFLKPKMSHSYFVGTKSACQFVVQISKVFILGSLIKDKTILYEPHILLSLAGIFVGNYLAKLVGEKIPENYFYYLVKIILLVLGLQLVIRGLSKYYS